MVLSKLLNRWDLTISHVDNAPRLVLIEMANEKAMGEDSRLQRLSLVLIGKVEVTNFSIVQGNIWELKHCLDSLECCCLLVPKLFQDKII